MSGVRSPVPYVPKSGTRMFDPTGPCAAIATQDQFPRGFDWVNAFLRVAEADRHPRPSLAPQLAADPAADRAAARAYPDLPKRRVALRREQRRAVKDLPTEAR